MQIDNKAAIIIIILVAAVFLWVANKNMGNSPNVSGNLPGSGSETGLILPG